jgi:hypothetical protein
VNRRQAIERLHSWASRAQQEAQEADTRENMLHWQGQAQVLSSIATFLGGTGNPASDDQIWKQVVADRNAALAAWEREQGGPEAMYYAGMVAGYDVAATALTDIAGRSWEIGEQSQRWVNR